MDTGIKEPTAVLSGLRQERGASMVEFAIVAPLLFLLIFGIIEFGLIMYDQAVITNASREGARFAAMYYTDTNGNPLRRTPAQVQTYVQTYVTNYLISFANSPSVTVSANIDQSDSGVGYVQSVTVSYPYQFLVFQSLIQLIKGSTTNPLTLTATTVMRDEDQFGLGTGLGG